jgi:predicted transcriptional regulator
MFGMPALTGWIAALARQLQFLTVLLRANPHGLRQLSSLIIEKSHRPKVAVDVLDGTVHFMELCKEEDVNMH